MWGIFKIKVSNKCELCMRGACIHQNICLKKRNSVNVCRGFIQLIKWFPFQRVGSSRSNKRQTPILDDCVKGKTQSTANRHHQLAAVAGRRVEVWQANAHNCTVTERAHVRKNFHHIFHTHARAHKHSLRACENERTRKYVQIMQSENAFELACWCVCRHRSH